MKKLQKQKIRQQLKEQGEKKKAQMFIDIMKDEMTKMSEDELNELSKSIMDLANLEEPTMEQINEVIEEAGCKLEEAK